MGQNESYKDNIRIAVIIATKNRPNELANRSLLSVRNQLRKPDIVVVVDDSDKKYKPLNEEIVSEFRCGYARIVYLENYRTSGASGAWNTAFSWLLREAPDSYIAILDDDDEWDATYLRKCEEQILKNKLDMIVAGIIRFDDSNPDGFKLSIPENFEAEQFLIGNPHIQGSNLFIRLQTILEAGAFDESLKSTTDRDICVRIADLGYVKVGFLREHLVYHYAFSSSERLSVAGSPNKIDGLRTFYRKYRPRMNAHQRASFINRAKDLFGFLDDDDKTENRNLSKSNKITVDENINLIIGFITSPIIEHTANLLKDISALSSIRPNIIKKVVILENSGENQDRRIELKRIIGATPTINIDFYPLEKQKSDIERFVFGKIFSPDIKNKSIAASRTMLQRYLYFSAINYKNPIVWILDDDSRLSTIYWDKEKGRYSKPWDFFEILHDLRNKDIDIVLCTVTGAPPLPFISCIRTQMVDLYHNLERLLTASPNTKLDYLEIENMDKRNHYRDYYYDLSRFETDHLEQPFWFYKSAYEDGTTLFIHMVNSLDGILRGEQIFRPLLATPKIHPFSTMIPSVNRGGNTIVLDIDALNEYPNYVPSVKGKEVRRSDMVWCLLNRFITGRKVVQVSLPVTHDRSLIKRKKLDFEKLREDIQGYAVYSALLDILRAKVQKRQLHGRKRYGRELMAFLPEEKREFVRLCKKYFTERITAFELSFYRVMGIIKMIRTRYLERNNNKIPWWLLNPFLSSSVDKLKSFLDVLDDYYNIINLRNLRKGFNELSEEVLDNYISNLEDAIYDYNKAVPLCEERLKNAKSFLSDLDLSNLRFLGHGKEGVLFTDDNKVYKYLENLEEGFSEDQINFLQSIVKKWNGLSTIYPLLSFQVREKQGLLIYPYEKGKPASRIDLKDIIQFLRECKSIGIVSNNVHPDNFIYTRSGLRFIDYGRDIHPYSETGFRRMCRRAYLSYRFPNWSNLKELMTLSIHQKDLPELYRFEHFLRALESRKYHQIYYPWIIKKVLDLEPKTILDYGCGKGKISEKIASQGINVVGYDVDKNVIERCRQYNSVVQYYDFREDGFLKKTYDLVLCSLVLCEIEDETEFKTVIEDLRNAVRETGHVLVTICNPFYTFTPVTEVHKRKVLNDKTYNDVFAYEEKIGDSNRVRKEIHRPFHVYKKAFLESGLIIDNVEETSTSDIEKLIPASDFLLFHLKPILRHDRNVTLMIKSCAMEWKAIDVHISHIVQQLEVPRFFKEKIAVIDLHSTEFLRQYDDANVPEYLEKLEKLVKDGIIDRYIITPNDDGERNRINKRWFNIDENVSHAENGQHTYPQLYGLEQCQSRYVLQVDSDLIIGRKDLEHDYIGDMLKIFENDSKVLTVSLNILYDSPKPYTYFYEENGIKKNWRVEVRGCLINMYRLKNCLPFPNEIVKKGKKNFLKFPWHRAFDKYVELNNFHSYRGGDDSFYFIHPPNEMKKDRIFLSLIMERVEKNIVFDGQVGRVDIVGTIMDWARPKRDESFIFIVCSRNVEPGKVKDCIKSMKKQTIEEWGAVIIDDASNNGIADYIDLLTEPIRNKVTYVRNKQKRGLLKSIWTAITHYCSNPNSIIITLDADDALIDLKVLERIKKEYDKGADATVGSMLRIDKETSYPVDFDRPRTKPGGGNVWQHLRTFRKYLFDRIKPEDLQIDGEWVDIATDWMFMLPIIEMAENPVYIEDKLYYYDPSERKAERRRKREDIISKIVSKPEYSKIS